MPPFLLGNFYRSLAVKIKIINMVTVSTDQDFASLLQQHNKVVVKYFANWCGTCRLFSPKFKKMSDKAEFAGVTFLDVNAEENPEARKLAGVSNLPYFAVFKDGKLVAADTTAKEDGVEKLIQQIL
jgi:thiol-disulfide isomerase/thioredoxin